MLAGWDIITFSKEREKSKLILNLYSFLLVILRLKAQVRTPTGTKLPKYSVNSFGLGPSFIVRYYPQSQFYPMVNLGYK